MDHVVGVVLAAGRGRRLGPLGETYVKTLLPVANEPVIVHHLRLLRGLGIRRVFIVVGHHADDVSAAVGTGERFGLDIQYVRQAAPLGSAHALSSLRSLIQSPFVLVLGDYYFVARDPQLLLRRLARGESVIATKHEPIPQLIREACAVAVDSENRVVDIIEKPVQPATDLKGTGLCALTPNFFDAVNRTPRTALRDEYELTVSLDIFVKMGEPLYAESIIEWDNNITRPSDLLQCNMEWLSRHAVSRLIGDETVIDDDVDLDQTVVGRGAVLHGASRLRQVVVFPGAEYSRVAPLEQSLVTPAGAIDCRSV